jgi:putative tryptophan/tyrosine transport system substrate-binding protein
VIRRREFIAGLGSAAAWPVVALAQQAALPVIGWLGSQSVDDDRENVTIPFLQSLKETGYVVGQNVAVEYRWAENQYDRLPALAADLVRGRVAVIVTSGTPAALAAKAATTTIPIVFSTGLDPVVLGLVASLNRPGANLSGAANLSAELAPKQLQLLRELIPKAAVFGILADPAFPGIQSTIEDLQAAAHTLGLQLIVVNARTDSDLEPAFASFSQQRVSAVLVSLSTFYSRRMEQLAALAARHALPAIYPYREYAEAGGLIPIPELNESWCFRYFGAESCVRQCDCLWPSDSGGTDGQMHQASGWRASKSAALEASRGSARAHSDGAAA